MILFLFDMLRLSITIFIVFLPRFLIWILPLNIVLFLTGYPDPFIGFKLVLFILTNPFKIIEFILILFTHPLEALRTLILYFISLGILLLLGGNSLIQFTEKNGNNLILQLKKDINHKLTSLDSPYDFARLRNARKLAQSCSSESVTVLSQVVIHNKDQSVVKISISALSNLESQEEVNAFCRVWAETRHKDLTAILKSRRYTSTEIDVRVLSALKVESLDIVKMIRMEALEHLLLALNDRDSEIAKLARICVDGVGDLSVKAAAYFLLGEWQKYEDLDFDQSLITKAYHSANEEGKKRIADKSKAAGRIEWVKILTNPKQGFNVEEMKDEDWSGFVDIIVNQPDRKEVWRFLYNAPAIWSKKLLKRLDKLALFSKYFNEDEKVTIKRLIKLSENCNSHSFDDLKYLYCSRIFLNTFAHFDKFIFDGNTIVIVKGSEYGDNMDHIHPSIYDVSLRQSISILSFPDGNIVKTYEDRTKIRVSMERDYYKDYELMDNYFGTPRISIALNSSIRTLACGGNCGAIRLWSLAHGKKTLEIYLTKDPQKYGCIDQSTYDDRFASLTFSPDGKLLVSSHSDDLTLWSLPVGYCVKTLKGHTSYVNSLAISPDGKLLVSSSLDKTIRLWSLPNGNFLKSLEGHTGSVDSLAISPDGKLLASGSYDKTIRLWSLPEGSFIKTLEGHPHGVLSLAISPDGKLLASGSYDNSIRLWNLPDGNFLKSLEGHTSGVNSLEFSLDGKFLASGSYDKTIRLWSIYDWSNIPINKFTSENVAEMELQIQNSKTEEGVRDAIKFTLALIRLRQQFDIDIEESSSNIQLSPYDIEIDD
jgi:WD40 repeat protein